MALESLWWVWDSDPLGTNLQSASTAANLEPAAGLLPAMITTATGFVGAEFKGTSVPGTKYVIIVEGW